MKISNVDVKTLKEKYGTPLYIYDVNHIKRNMDGYLNYFKSNEFETEVLFASKALNIKELIRICMEKKISFDQALAHSSDQSGLKTFLQQKLGTSNFK